MTEKLDLTFYAAGVKFRPNWKANLNQLKEGDGLLLVPEDNKYAKNPTHTAIRLENKGIHLGYVPEATGELDIILNSGEILTAEISALDTDFEPWKALEVNVKEV